MKFKKLLTMALAGALLIGGVVTAHGAELDLAWYAEKNPDVVAELGNSPEALRQHYEMHGRKEGRMANNHDAEAKLRRLFNAKEYGALYPDVKEFYGADEEAMFQHYISFGLLEARRPSEKVSQAAAVSLKKSVEKALTDAGIAAVPGSAEVAALIVGTVSDVAQSAEAAKALTQVAAVVEDAVAETYEEVTNPKPAPSSGGSGSSPSTPSTPEEPAAESKTIMLYRTVRHSGSALSEIGEAAPVTTTGGRGTIDAPYTVTVTGITLQPGADSACWFAVGLPVEEEKGTLWWWQGKDTDGENPPAADAYTKMGEVAPPEGFDLPEGYALCKLGMGGLDDNTAYLCLKAADADAAGEGIYYKLTVQYADAPTVYAYKNMEFNNEGKVVLNSNTEESVTAGNGSASYPFVASVENIGREAKQDDVGTWFAVSLPKPAGDNMQYWLKIGSTWTNVTANQKLASSALPENTMTFGIACSIDGESAEGRAGVVELCMSTDTASLTSGTYYKLNITFAEETAEDEDEEETALEQDEPDEEGITASEPEELEETTTESDESTSESDESTSESDEPGETTVDEVEQTAEPDSESVR